MWATMDGHRYAQLNGYKRWPLCPDHPNVIIAARRLRPSPSCAQRYDGKLCSACTPGCVCRASWFIAGHQRGSLARLGQSRDGLRHTKASEVHISYLWRAFDTQQAVMWITCGQVAGLASDPRDLMVERVS